MAKVKKTVNNTKLVCPKCGAEFALPNQGGTIAVGVVIGHDSGLGRIEMPLENKKEKELKEFKKSKAHLRLQAMEAAGIDTSDFFAMKDNKGELTKIVKQNEDGTLVEVSDPQDPIVQQIINAGSLRNAHLFKQHVLAMMLKMLTKRSYSYVGHIRIDDYERDTDGDICIEYYQEALNRLGYDYQWRMLVDELSRQASMFKHGDKTSFEEDNRWFNKELVLKMFDDYVKKLGKLLEDAPVKRCKGEEYIRFKFNRDIFKFDENKSGYLYVKNFGKLISVVKRLRTDIAKAKTPKDLYLFVHQFYTIAPKLYAPGMDYDKLPAQSKDWQDAYKGYGAYFSMQNLIRFHNCHIYQISQTRKPVELGKGASLQLLDEWARDKKGYWLLGALKQMILDNNFDIAAKREEWAKKYSGEDC